MGRRNPGEEKYPRVPRRGLFVPAAISPFSRRGARVASHFHQQPSDSVIGTVVHHRRDRGRPLEGDRSPPRGGPTDWSGQKYFLNLAVSTKVRGYCPATCRHWETPNRYAPVGDSIVRGRDADRRTVRRWPGRPAASGSTVSLPTPMPRLLLRWVPGRSRGVARWYVSHGIHPGAQDGVGRMVRQGSLSGRSLPELYKPEPSRVPPRVYPRPSPVTEGWSEGPGASR